MMTTQTGNLVTTAEIASQRAEMDAHREWHAVDINEQLFRAVTQAAGFSARFEESLVKDAVIELISDGAIATFEISKNAKPLDVGLRYTREIWEVGETRTTRNSVISGFIADSALRPLREIIETQISHASNPHHPIVALKVNLKQKRFLFATKKHQEQNLEQFSVEPRLGSEKFQNSPNIETERNVVMPTETLTRSEANSASATQEKYSTYSRSEVDRLLKAQAETIVASLGGKLSNQSKLFEETLTGQERAFNRSIDKIVEHIDEFKIKLNAAAVEQNVSAKEEFARFKTELTRELEQFKASLNKSLVPNVKAIDEKMAHLSQVIQEKPQVAFAAQSNTILTVFVGASLLASIVSIVLQFVHH